MPTTHTTQILPATAFWPSRLSYRRATKEVKRPVMTRKPTVLDCKRFIGKPMTRDEAQRKMENCDNFKSLAEKSKGLWRRDTKDDDLVGRAVALDYGNRLRACLADSKSKRVKHRTPY